MRSRNGKIARLPKAVREELNQRLERCEQSPQLLAWLNALPEVREFLQREFDGVPINKQSLSRWRLGGYLDWLTRKDFFDDVGNAEDFAAENGEGRKSKLADQAATVLAARFAGLIMRWDGECTSDFEARARVLSGLARGVVQLQREAHRTGSRPVTLSHGDKIVEKPLTGNSWHKPDNSE